MATPLKSVNIASREFKANPFPFYARLRAEAPVYPVTLPVRRTAWLVTRYQDVAAILRDERFVKDMANALTPEQTARQPWIPPVFRPLIRNMLNLDGLDHARLRGLVQKAFSPQIVEQMRGRVERLCDDLLDPLLRRGNVDLVRDYALPVPVTVISEMLGVPAADRHKFHRWSVGLVSAGSSRWGLLWAIPSVWFLIRFLRKLIRLRRDDPRDDLVSMLVKVEEAGDRLSEDELLAMVTILLIAGHETTVNLIANGTLALLEHPDQLRRLSDDPSLLRPAVEELLRYTSPVEMASERYAREDVTIAGVTVPRGSLILAVIASANRDEQQFPDPDKLDITREPNKHLSFGLGAHYCLGASLARMEGQLALAALLRRVKDLRLAAAPGSLRWRRGLILRGLESLPVSFAARRQAG
jgi:cytochrome P450 PksS